MKLFDSNILIYAAKPRYDKLRHMIATEPFLVSSISKVEVFGYQGLDEDESRLLSRWFSKAKVHPITDRVLHRAIELRQRRKVGVVDAIIAGTALLLEAELVTRNTEDFDWISGLKLSNPFDDETKS